MSIQLPDPQLAILTTASATTETSIEQLADETDLNPTTATQAAFELRDAELLTITETETTLYELTNEGREYLADGLPEIRLYQAATEIDADDAPVSLGSVIQSADLDDPEIDIALANFARKSYGSITDGEITAAQSIDPNSDSEATALAHIDSNTDAGKSGETARVDSDSIADVDDSVVEQLVTRNLLTRYTETTRTVSLTDAGVTALMEGVESVETVDRLTPELIMSGEWRDAEFAEYNVEADAPDVQNGKIHILRQTAERVRDVLVGMGFEEMDGPHADADFWINDCLFMPQDHPARTHWDRFALDVPPIDDLPTDLVETVESAHRDGVGSDGDGYHSPWDEDFARAIALRGHTTSLSMRYLSGTEIGEFEPPQRYFSVEKVYRNDTLDATHLLEFFQIEGWVMAEDLSVRDLMGTFVEFYEQFGITDVQFKPHYNPYTEPSFELFGQHPKTGELIEIGNSGMFRTEVLDPLGVECDVMAWGLALERLAMLTTGAEDIRDLHGTLADLEFLRNAEVTY
ncbi:MAG: phenylalanyl-tRNA synthetase, alpha subunit [Haloquadratum walsbyi J07HQW2]|jgi:phenylalanyl-tRNA synthetase, alpha subunit (EC 6.1.1.20)|uniref:Phenylalanine--tRNA ligase alpha subunit n=1 Tax=Haloquadratum walsbyi J07HQW2 TaxID=1238425 RepID=U1PQE9_9EURY|nr:MAG: phenylalanyl-tRNA synthetase, alpha subunit [Haloquadratum walsbyi J07HQW2]